MLAKKTALVMLFVCPSGDVADEQVEERRVINEFERTVPHNGMDRTWQVCDYSSRVRTSKQHAPICEVGDE
jgi:hypothetical protein